MSVNKAILLEKENEPAVVKDWKVPKATEDAVVVKNEFAGVNFIDTYQLARLSANYEVPFPYVLGREGAGTVSEVGPAKTDLKVGDRVVYFAQGAFANYVKAPLTNVHKLPDSVPSDVAAATLLQGLTGWFLVKDSHVVKPGQWVLVHAAAGGMGLILCQLAKLLGGRIIGTASTDEKLELAKSHGAEFTINYSHEDVEKRVMEITQGKGANVIYDGVGKDTFQTDLKIVAINGSVITYGNASGPVAPVAPLALASRNIRLMRPTLFNYISDPQAFQEATTEVFDLLAKDKLKINIHKVYPLADVAQAHKDLTGRKSTGKLLINCKPEA